MYNLAIQAFFLFRPPRPPCLSPAFRRAQVSLSGTGECSENGSQPFCLFGVAGQVFPVRHETRKPALAVVLPRQGAADYGTMFGMEADQRLSKEHGDVQVRGEDFQPGE